MSKTKKQGTFREPVMELTRHLNFGALAFRRRVVRRIDKHLRRHGLLEAQREVHAADRGLQRSHVSGVSACVSRRR
jgi:hypothetical protein